MKQESDQFGDRMKEYEKSSETLLNIVEPIVMRIDGKRFSKYTKHLEKPFDERLFNIFVKTVGDVANIIKADVAYYQSDEISFVFLPKEGKTNIEFGGRVQKLCSVYASIFTSHFIYNMSEYNRSENGNGMKVSETPYFDARVFNVDNISEAANSILWRIKDCQKNYCSCVFRYKKGHREMQGLSGKEMIDILDQEGFDHSDMVKYRHGIIFMKKYMEMQSDTGEKYVRSKYHVDTADKFANMSHEERIGELNKIIKKTAEA